MAKLERMDETAPENEVLLERDDTDVALDILNELNAAPGDTNWRFTVCRINTDKNGVAVNGALEPQIMEGDASIMDDLAARLREQFGSGRYRIRVLQNKRLWKRFDIAVERATTATPVATAERPSEMATVLGAIEKSNERMMALMERISERAAVPAVAAVASDPFAAMEKMLGVIQKMMPAPRPAEDTAAKSVELILQGIELGKSVSGEARETGMMDIVKDLLSSPLVVKLAENMGQSSQPQIQLPPPNRRRPPAPAPASNGQAQPPAPEAPQQPTANAAQVEEIRRILLYLNVRAEHGSSYETYAEWAFDTLPPPMITGLLAEHDPVAVLISVAPEIGPQAQWFKSLIDELRLLVNDAQAQDIEGGQGIPNAPGTSPSPVGPYEHSRGEGGGTDDAENNE